MPTTTLADLRAVLDHIESEPVLRDHDGYYLSSDGVMFFAWNPNESKELVRALRGTIESPVRKLERDSAQYQKFARAFGTAFIYVVDYGTDRCERVQVGERVAEVERVVTPAVVEMVTETVPVFEWRCAPVLATVEPAPVVDDAEPF